MIDEKKIIEFIKSNDFKRRTIQSKDSIQDILIQFVDKQPKVGEWIPVICRETTEEDGIDKERYPFFLDCRLPDDEQEIIICMKNGYVCTDTSFNDDGCYLDSGRDWMDVIAWMPLPEPYRPCTNTDCVYNSGNECPASEGCGGYQTKGE